MAFTSTLRLQNSVFHCLMLRIEASYVWQYGVHLALGYEPFELLNSLGPARECNFSSFILCFEKPRCVSGVQTIRLHFRVFSQRCHSFLIIECSGTWY